MTNAEFNIDLDGTIFEKLREFKSSIDKIEASVKGLETNTKNSFSKIGDSLKVLKFTHVTQGLQNLNQGLTDLNGPGLKFQTSLADLQAITGVTDGKLKELGDSARENAKKFGGDGAKSVETYKLLLSQLTPELAKQPRLLNEMSQNAEVLAKTMGGDVVGATEVLTTAMNQYGVDVQNPVTATKEMTRMMNVMAAAAKEGSAELPTIKQAVENVGGQAKLSGLSFEQLNSQIQLLDKAGKKGAEGGTALRSILVTLSKGRFLPKETKEQLEAAGVSVSALADKNVSFTDKMRMLQPVLQKDSALISVLFGEYGQAASSLIEGADASDKMTAAITGTNTANKQAAVIMRSTEEKVARMKARIDDAKLAFFEATGGATAYLAPITELATTFSAFAPLLGSLGKGFMLFTQTKLAGAIATKVITAAQWLWNAALSANPIGLVIVAVAALGAAIYGISKAFDTSTAAEKRNTEMKQRALDKSADERVELTLLFDRLRHAKKGTDEYTGALSELDKKYPGIIAKYKLHEGSLKDINRAEKELIANIIKRSEVEALGEMLKEKTKERMSMKTRELTWDESAAQKTMFISEKEFRKRMQVRLYKEEQALSAQLMGKQRAMDGQKDEVGMATPDGMPIDPSISVPTPTNKPLVSPGGYSEKQSSGAGEMKNINVRIEKLVEKIEIHSSNLTEATGKIKQQITEAMVGAVRDFEVAL